MQRKLRVSLLMLLVLALASVFAPGALAASRPASVRIATDADVGTPEQLKEAQVDAIWDMADK